jgi:hypothetical protein
MDMGGRLQALMKEPQYSMEWEKEDHRAGVDTLVDKAKLNF